MEVNTIKYQQITNKKHLQTYDFLTSIKQNSFPPYPPFNLNENQNEIKQLLSQHFPFDQIVYLFSIPIKTYCEQFHYQYSQTPFIIINNPFQYLCNLIFERKECLSCLLLEIRQSLQFYFILYMNKMNELYQLQQFNEMIQLNRNEFNYENEINTFTTGDNNEMKQIHQSIENEYNESINKINQLQNEIIQLDKCLLLMKEILNYFIGQFHYYQTQLNHCFETIIFKESELTMYKLITSFISLFIEQLSIYQKEIESFLQNKKQSYPLVLCFFDKLVQVPVMKGKQFSFKFFLLTGSAVSFKSLSIHSLKMIFQNSFGEIFSNTFCEFQYTPFEPYTLGKGSILYSSIIATALKGTSKEKIEIRLQVSIDISFENDDNNNLNKNLNKNENQIEDLDNLDEDLEDDSNENLFEDEEDNYQNNNENIMIEEDQINQINETKNYYTFKTIFLSTQKLKTIITTNPSQWLYTQNILLTESLTSNSLYFSISLIKFFNGINTIALHSHETLIRQQLPFFSPEMIQYFISTYLPSNQLFISSNISQEGIQHLGSIFLSYFDILMKRRSLLHLQRNNCLFSFLKQSDLIHLISFAQLQMKENVLVVALVFEYKNETSFNTNKINSNNSNNENDMNNMNDSNKDIETKSSLSLYYYFNKTIYFKQIQSFKKKDFAEELNVISLQTQSSIVLLQSTRLIPPFSNDSFTFISVDDLLNGYSFVD